MTKRAKSMLDPSQILMPLCCLCVIYSEANVLFFQKKNKRNRRFNSGLEKKERGFEPTKKAVHQGTKPLDTRPKF